MERQMNIQTGLQLSTIIDKVVKESIKQALYQNAIAEKERQGSLTEEDDDAENSEKEVNTSSKTQDDIKEKMRKGDVTASDVIERLNSIRSGRSFKDEEIASKLEEYVNSLAKAEKVALLAFLKGISQVVTGEIPAETAVSPDENPANVEMKKGNEKKKVAIKPVVVKTPAPKQGDTKKTSSEDSTGPVPIKAKK